jgi:hypothetical protein
MEADAKGEAGRVAAGLTGSDAAPTPTGGPNTPGRPVRAGWRAGALANERTWGRGRLAASADRKTRYASTYGDARITQLRTTARPASPYPASGQNESGYLRIGCQPWAIIARHPA